MQMARKGDRVEDRLLEPGSPQGRHAAPERTDAREDHGCGVADQADVGREAGVGAHVVERLLGRAEVADAVVGDGDERRVAGRRRAHSIPLVDGMPVPSTRTA